MEQELYQAACIGSVEWSVEIMMKAESGVILEKMADGLLGCTPLHLAASRGHAAFLHHFLNLDPKYGQVLDSQKWSPLHHASAEGHINVVKELVRTDPNLCLARDRQGRTPLHLAAINGRVGVLGVLVRANSHAAQARSNDGDSVLHLCVKHNHLETLKLLLRMIKSPEFVNARDAHGNTILHLAVSDKQLQMVQYLLNYNNIDVNATNNKGNTAMDIVMLAQRSGLCSKDFDDGNKAKKTDYEIEGFLGEANAKESKDLVQGEWIKDQREALMVVAALIATITFQAGVNPPGGSWQDNSYFYPWFLRFNAIGFVASLSMILLLISGLRFTKRTYILGLTVILWLTIILMAISYAISIVWMTSKWDREYLICSLSLASGIVVWCITMSIFVLPDILQLVRSELKGKRRTYMAIGRIKHPHKLLVEECNGKNHNHNLERV